MSTTAPKRCLYEVIGLPQTCTPDEIRSAYKKLALQRHPDKLVQSGVSSADATASFQELVHAYEVLSDPKERQWYDSHRSQILFSDLSSSDNNNKSSPSNLPNLFSFFSPSCYTDYTDPKKGFYKVYSDVFDKIYANEVNYARTLGLGLVKEAPMMGDLKSPFTQANAFYAYWLGFATVMDFGWVDQWDASRGQNRKERRLMEEENKKARKKVRREFNETVRGLAEFVKKRDKRVVDMMVAKEKEREKKRREEAERRKEMERVKLEKARLFKEPEWARVEEVEEEEEEDINEEDEEERNELYCVVCGKKFKSEKQWKNHERSRKHKEKVAELKEEFDEEDEEHNDGAESDGVEGVQQNDGVESDGVEGEEDAQQNDDDDAGFESAGDGLDELEEEFKEVLSVQEEGSGGELPSETEDNDVEEEKGIESDDEWRILEAMISGRKSKKNGVGKKQPEVDPTSEVRVESEEEEEVVMEYNNRKKGSRKSRRAKPKEFKEVVSRSRGDLPSETEDNDVEDDEMSVLEAMISGRKSKKNGVVKKQPEVDPTSEVPAGSEDEEEVAMEYNNRKKGIRKSRRAKGAKGKKVEEGVVEGTGCDANAPNEENGVKSNVETHSGGIGNEASFEDNVKHKGRKRDTKTKPSSKSTKQKGKTKQSALFCEQCEEEFESRNKLHMHLSDTGHASLKSR